MKNDLTGVKVDDRLWSSVCGWGTVTDLDPIETTYPIVVDFDCNDECYSFTFEGFYILLTNTQLYFGMILNLSIQLNHFLNWKLMLRL